MINKILVVNPGPVYPIRAMNQIRTHNMIKTLSKDFRVDLLAPYIDDVSYNASCKAISETGGEYIPLKSVKHKKNLLRKRTVQLLEYLAYLFFSTDREVTTNRLQNHKIETIIKEKGYKIVIGNYWEGSLFFRRLDKDVYKILDTHYSVGENMEVLLRLKRSKIKILLEKRKLKKNAKLEREIVSVSDLILPLSVRGLEELRMISSDKTMLLIPDGADLDYYLSYPSCPDPMTLLFYGSMGSAQNRNAFMRLYKNIFPVLIKQYPGLRLLVVGANPPEEIKSLDNGKDVIVTGFVEDVRPWLAEAWTCVIPLELGSGFRGRVIELMAMGIPVVGTQNALDSIGFKNGIHGFINDSDDKLTEYCIELIRNKELRNKLSKNAKQFVLQNYSLESTFGKLNSFLKNKF